MLIFNRPVDLKAHLQKVAPATNNRREQTIGFVPTMGALHDGHLSLLSTSMKANDLTVISIFVNPTQFNNPEDLARYPRTLGQDVARIGTLSASIIVFAPSVDDIYDGNTVSEHFDFDGLEHQMEGRFRPGHFDGVGTIVRRLFEIVGPDNAYFGEKDFQQLQIVRKLVAKTGLPVNVIGCPIFREANGLAMSSRNERLSAAEREQASVIYRTLQQARTLFGTQDVKQVSDFVTGVFDHTAGFTLEYFEIADESTLQPATVIEPGKKYRAFIAVFVNNIRLIDTISLN